MSEKFKAIVINQQGENFTREVKSIEKTFLKHGDVLVKVDYSGLNMMAMDAKEGISAFLEKRKPKWKNK